jgi:hypothetical protein
MSQVPTWLPEWLQAALQQPTMSVPDVGRALFKAEKYQAYELVKQGAIPIVRGGRRMEVPTMWVRRQLMLDGERPRPRLSK